MAPNSNYDVRILTFKEAPNSNFDAQVLCFQRGPKQQLQV